MRIHAFDERQLPLSAPPLEALFTGDRISDVLMVFVVDKPLDVVAGSEAVIDLVTVLPDATDEIIRDADVESAIAPGGQYVDGPGAGHEPRGNI